jgi:polyisoprenoid-binding protein YceI
MRNFTAYVVAQLTMASLYAQTAGHSFVPVDEGSTIGFKIKNFGFNNGGTFKGLRGTIVFDPKNVAGDSFDVSVEAASINTDNDMRDDHLRKEAYFDVEKYPRIRFVSTSVVASDKSGHFMITGKLTIKGTTKQISFPFLAAPAGNDYIFKGSFAIKRRDFDVGGASTLSNDLTVSLTVLARVVR